MRLVGFRLAPRREPVPGVARAAAADESGNEMPRTGCCRMGGRWLLPQLGFSRRRKTLGVETGVSPHASPRVIPGCLLRQLFMLEELMA